MSDSLWPHESQHARPPCLSPTPGDYSNSCPSSQWCHPACHPLSSPSPPAPNPSQHQGLFQSGPITSWEIDGETVETVADFNFGGSKITADSDYSHEIKRRLLLGRKVMTNLDSILKGRDITWPTKVCLVKAMVFPVVMYGCESWTMKKAEHWRVDAFELWCWRRLLRVPWTARRSSQSILKISPWVFIGRTDAKAETSILWPPDAKSWLIGKDMPRLRAKKAQGKKGSPSFLSGLGHVT